MKDLYRGTLVRLASESLETMSKSYMKWDMDSGARRLGSNAPIQLWSEKKIKESFEKHDGKSEKAFRFSIYTLADDKLIGNASLWVESWAHSDAWLGIYIGERDHWGRGFGTDTTRLIVQYGFCELNLRRITLGVYSYNERALKSYLKVGFQVEGRFRGDGLRDGVRFDGICMGLLREEWNALQGAK